MRQRPQEVVKAFADAGHPAYFVDNTATSVYQDGGVTVIPTLDAAPRSDVILYIHFAPVAQLAERFSNPTIIYDILDDLSIYEPDEIGLPAERTVAYHHTPLMETAHVVTASSQELVERHHSERADIILAENGVDTSRFKPDGGRQDLGRSPVIGYHGAIAHWFDFELLRDVASARPEWTFPIVGPVRPDVSEQAGAIGLPNVHFLGERGPDDIGSFVRSFDVGVVWFKVNRLTEGVSPLKVYEWLASGVAAVSVPLPAVLADPLVESGDSVVSIVEAVEKALHLRATPGWAEQAALATSGSTWTARISPVRAHLEAIDLLTV